MVQHIAGDHVVELAACQLTGEPAQPDSLGCLQRLGKPGQVVLRVEGRRRDRALPPGDTLQCPGQRAGAASQLQDRLPGQQMQNVPGGRRPATRPASRSDCPCGSSTSRRRAHGRRSTSSPTRRRHSAAIEGGASGFFASISGIASGATGLTRHRRCVLFRATIYWKKPQPQTPQRLTVSTHDDKRADRRGARVEFGVPPLRSSGPPPGGVGGP